MGKLIDLEGLSTFKALMDEEIEGSHEVYVGTEEPVGSNITLWVNPEGEPEDDSAAKGLLFVEGTQASSTNAWTGRLEDVDELYNGLTIAYKLPFPSNGQNVTLSLLLSETQTQAIPVYTSGGKALKKQYRNGDIIILTYYQNTWKTCDINTHIGYVSYVPESETGYDGPATGTLFLGTDEGFTPNAAGYTLLRVPSAYNWTAGSTDVTLKAYITEGYGHSTSAAYNLNVNGNTVLGENGASQILIPSGNYLMFYDGNNTIYINTLGYLPGLTATSSQSGLMSAADKNALETLQTSVSFLNGISYHICVPEEYDSETRVPNILNPVSNTLYLVPGSGSGEESLFTEWFYRNNQWEEFGNAQLNLDAAIENNQTLNEIQAELLSAVDGAYVEDGVAYFTHGDNVLFELTGIGGGGGGGGQSDSDSIVTLTNETGWTSKTVAQNSEVELSLTWSSLEQEAPTGNGTMRVTVNDAIKETRNNIPQGSFTVSVGSYLSAGSNTVIVTVIDSYGKSKKRNFIINAVEMRLTSPFDGSIVRDSAFAFPFVPYGSIVKTVHFEVDGTELPTVSVSTSGTQVSNTIPQQTHGDHTLRVWFTATIDGETVASNVLYYNILCIVPGTNTTVIASAFSTNSVPRYTTVIVPYQVYNPNSLVSNVTIQLNGNTMLEMENVGREANTFTLRMDVVGSNTITISSGGTTKTLTVNVTQSDIDVEAETQNLALYLSSAGRSNMEANPGVWTYGTGNDQISAVFTGFNFISDGWQTDDDGLVALRVKGNATLTIPYKIFAEDFRTNGKTVEIEFATRDVRNYSDVIIDCMNAGRGIQITSQDCMIASEQTSLKTQFKEEERVRVGFVIDKRNGMRLIRCFLNGILSGVAQYPTNDDFSQVSPVNITIHSTNNTVDVYTIRIYDNDLTSTQMVNNWIADTQDGALLTERFAHNNIRDAYGNIVISKLPADLPYMIIAAAELPQYKGDKKTVSGSYTDPLQPSKSFTFTNAQCDVQGTSSQYYARKNYKIKFNGGFTNPNGVTSSKYKMRDDSIAVKTFTFKADVASSEGANNVELAIAYNDACPYKTPAQEENEQVRQGIDGFPMVIFWQNTISGETSFLGKYNFNNDKGTEEVFGFEDGDESWEIKNNTSDRVIWKNADYTGDDWLNDFEARYPDTDPPYTDATQLAEFASWIKSTDPTEATNNALSPSVNYSGTTYTVDSAEYRRAKFRNELSDYVEVDSALFYYIFTELFLMVDSRAKNAFPSFMGTEIV